jgi:hypothetical protein
MKEFTFLKNWSLHFISEEIEKIFHKEKILDIKRIV